MGAVSKMIKNSFSGGGGGNFYAYNNSAIQYLGRFNDTGVGKWTGWGGCQIVFQVRNTSFVTVYANVIDPSASALCFAGVAVDNSQNRKAYYWSSIPQIFTGRAYITIPVTNDGNWHNITITPAGFIYDTYPEISKVTVTGYEVGGYGEIATWTQGATRVQCIGDSWMGATEDWPRLMGTSTYNLFCVSGGGMKCSDMDTQYSFDYSGVPAVSDPVCSKVVIGFGVNDTNASVTVPAFQTSLSSLTTQVRSFQPSATIYYARIPNNGGLLYGQYGAAMSNVQAVTANSIYIDTTSIEGSLVWADAGHLNGPSKQALATYVAGIIA